MIKLFTIIKWDCRHSKYVLNYKLYKVKVYNSPSALNRKDAETDTVLEPNRRERKNGIRMLTVIFLTNCEQGKVENEKSR